MISERTWSWGSTLRTRSGHPKGIVVHHAAASSASVEDIHRWHIARGWAGIGYHFYVRKDGTIYRGRPEGVIGSHAQGANDRLGICLEGDYTTETMPHIQRTALVWLLRDLLRRYGALPVTGHSAHSATACPGRNVPLSDIVKEAGSAAPPKEAPVTTPYRIVTAECSTLVVRNAIAKMCAGLNMAHTVLGRAVVFHGHLERVREVEAYIEAQSGNVKRTHGVMVEAGTHNPLNQHPPHGRFTDSEAFAVADTRYDTLVALLRDLVARL